MTNADQSLRASRVTSDQIQARCSANEVSIDLSEGTSSRSRLGDTLTTCFVPLAGTDTYTPLNNDAYFTIRVVAPQAGLVLNSDSADPDRGGRLGQVSTRTALLGLFQRNRRLSEFAIVARVVDGGSGTVTGAEIAQLAQNSGESGAQVSTDRTLAIVPLVRASVDGRYVSNSGRRNLTANDVSIYYSENSFNLIPYARPDLYDGLRLEIWVLYSNSSQSSIGNLAEHHITQDVITNFLGNYSVLANVVDQAWRDVLSSNASRFSATFSVPIDFDSPAETTRWAMMVDVPTAGEKHSVEFGFELRSRRSHFTSHAAPGANAQSAMEFDVFPGTVLGKTAFRQNGQSLSLRQVINAEHGSIVRDLLATSNDRLGAIGSQCRELRNALMATPLNLTIYDAIFAVRELVREGEEFSANGLDACLNGMDAFVHINNLVQARSVQQRVEEEQLGPLQRATSSEAIDAEDVTTAAQMLQAALASGLDGSAKMGMLSGLFGEQVDLSDTLGALRFAVGDATVYRPIDNAGLSDRLARLSTGLEIVEICDVADVPDSAVGHYSIALLGRLSERDEIQFIELRAYYPEYKPIGFHAQASGISLTGQDDIECPD